MAKPQSRIKLTVFSVLIAVLIMGLNTMGMQAEKENKHRVFIMTLVRQGVEQYFSEHGSYPQNIALLNLHYQPTVLDFIEGGVLRYERDMTGKKWFSLSCRSAGIFPMGNDRYRLSWSGVQYSNDINHLPLPVVGALRADANGFYPADFH